MLPATRFAALPAFVRQAAHSVTFPRGFRAAGVPAGIKRSNQLDVGLLASDAPCSSVALFTGNAAAAAPVRVTRDSCACDRLRGVVANSGNANACTGERGWGDAARMRRVAADALRLSENEVAVCSTGVIGLPLPMERVEAGIGMAAAKLATDGGPRFAAAIRTTDRTAKHGALALDLAQGEVRLGLAAKGAGMISPAMATMLCFVTTDAALPPLTWQRIVTNAVQASFNRITVDGQESTNDTVLALANGASGITPDDDGLATLDETLRAALTSLAVAIVADGEGASKVVRLTVEGAADDEEADEVARAVGDSPLVKTAFFGEDPNWGRVLQAAGQTVGRRNGGRPFVADLAYNGTRVVHGGTEVPLDEAARLDLARLLEDHEIDLTLALNRGSGRATLFFSDLTHDYVTLNAEYTT